MCVFFSGIVTRDGRILFYEGDSHEEIVRRANLRLDENPYLLYWVRVERPLSPSGQWAQVRVDESTTPGWFEDRRDELEQRVAEIAERVRTPRETFEKTMQEAREAYDAAVRPAEEAYQAAVRPAQEAYDAVARPTREAYDAATRSAWEAYDAATRSAQRTYLTALQPLEGYVPDALR